MKKLKEKKEVQESKSRVARAFYLIGGFISLILGCIGIVIPILPTAPFLLVTSFCFVKGSKKFHSWFLNTKLYKKQLESFVKHQAMNIKFELMLVAIVSGMLIFAMVLVNKVAMTIAICILLAIKYLYFIIKIKPVTKAELIIIKEENQ